MTEAPPIRILVVDDDPGVRYTLREILASEGLEVEEAADGAAALSAFGARPAPLVVTDLRMPGVDGMELLRRLAAGEEACRDGADDQTRVRYVTSLND